MLIIFCGVEAIVVLNFSVLNFFSATTLILICGFPMSFIEVIGTRSSYANKRLDRLQRFINHTKYDKLF